MTCKIYLGGGGGPNHIDNSHMQTSFYSVFLTVPHGLKSFHTFKHTLPKHTHSTYHSKVIAKHTTNYIWTVSLTDQTHVDSLTFNLSVYDYSSSSDCSVWVAMLLLTLESIESIPCLLFNLIYFFIFIYLGGFTAKTLIVSLLHIHTVT